MLSRSKFHWQWGKNRALKNCAGYILAETPEVDIRLATFIAVSSLKEIVHGHNIPDSCDCSNVWHVSAGSLSVALFFQFLESLLRWFHESVEFINLCLVGEIAPVIKDRVDHCAIEELCIVSFGFETRRFAGAGRV